MKKLTLTSRFDDTVDIDGVIYTINLSFDNVLRVFELFSDGDFTPSERVVTAFEMFVNEPTTLSFSEMDKAIFSIFKDFLDIDLSEKSDPNLDKEKFYDLYEDAERIYATFISVYGMDLFEQQGKLHFKKFSTLLGQAIDRDFKEIVGIRARKLPKLTKYNAEERKHIIELKSIYKLNGVEDEELTADKVERGWDKVANYFRPGR